MLITCPSYNKRRATEHKKHARKNKRCKDARMSNDDQSYPSFLFPSHLDYDELVPHHGLFKNTLCESVRASPLLSCVLTHRLLRSSDICTKAHHQLA